MRVTFEEFLSRLDAILDLCSLCSRWSQVPAAHWSMAHAAWSSPSMHCNRDCHRHCCAGDDSLHLDAWQDHGNKPRNRNWHLQGLDEEKLDIAAYMQNAMTVMTHLAVKDPHT